MPPSTLPTSRASPSMASPRMCAAKPASVATAAAASSAACGVAIMRISARASRWSPGFTDSPRPLSSNSIAAAGEQSMSCRRTMSSASRQVVGSATVGPEAMSSGRSPGTSDITSAMTRAGWHAAASRPPLIADRWRRTQFISAMVAPLASIARLTACLSSSVRPGSGSGSSAEPPPEIRHSDDVVRAAGRCTLASMRCPCAACMPGVVGHRVRGLDDLDAAARRAVAVARHHESGQRAAPVLFDRLRHRGRGLAGADHHQPTGAEFVGPWQVRRHAARGLRAGHGGVEHAAQQRGLARHHAAWPISKLASFSSARTSAEWSHASPPWATQELNSS